MSKRRDAGSGGIERTPAGTYKVVLDAARPDPVTGKRNRYRKTFKTLREAQQAVREVLSNRDHGLDVKPETVTTGEWLKGWLVRHLANGSISPATHDRYETIVRVHLTPRLGHIRLQDLRRDHVADMAADWTLGDKAIAAASARKNLTVLRTALSDALRSDLIVRNPAEHVKSPLPPSDLEKRALTQIEIAELLRTASGTRFDAPIGLTVSTGLRRGELLALRWADLDLKDGRLHVRRALSFVAGRPSFHEPKSKGRRTITLSSETVRLMRRHRIAQNERRLASPVEWPEDEMVFTSSVGTVWSFRNFLRDYRVVLVATNISDTASVNWHTLRHTAASQWIAAGASVFEVARRLGHSTTATTERVYAHLLPRQDATAAQALDHLIAT